MKKNASLAMLAGSLVIFGTIGIFRRSIPLPSGLIACIRGAVGALFLLLLLFLRGRRMDGAAIRRHGAVLALSGAMIGFNWILLFEAYNYTTVATATLCYYMAPIFVLLASPFLLKERLTGKKVACVLSALIGMVPVSGVLHENVHGLRGVLFGLGAAVLYAGVMLLNQKLRPVPTYDKTIVQLGCASIVLLPYVALFERGSGVAAVGVTGWILLAVVGIVHTGIAYAMYFGSMEAISAQTVAIFSYIDPVVAVLLSALLLKEKMGLPAVIGAVLILGAAFISEWKEK